MLAKGTKLQTYTYVLSRSESDSLSDCSSFYFVRSSSLSNVYKRLYERLFYEPSRRIKISSYPSFSVVYDGFVGDLPH